ncbi:MAG TPA: DUF1800 domain-containing protein [Steroidobacteraceae bacterium]|nr:DUF1800 domain-containing protein [Steroidobacteraceae bacterium]
MTLAGCAASTSQHPATTAAAHGSAAIGPSDGLKRQDALWLDRVSYGLNSHLVQDYRRLGRARWLDEQLRAQGDSLPAPIAAQIDRLDISHQDVSQLLADLQARRKAIKAMTDGDEKESARKAMNETGNRYAYQTVQRELLRAVYSPAQLREQMVWFWVNHFSVFQYKGELRWLIADYEDRAIRPHALGHFKDLVLATLQHPAMLQYLDNQQNGVNHINENYARELMELHTLGVGSGYTQQDVQQLARVLTGSSIGTGPEPHLRPQWQGLYLRRGAFEFNPARHDFEPKMLLGHTIEGKGFTEVETAVDLIVRQPACAHFISQQLATYFVADTPPPQLVKKMQQTFERTDGDIAEVLRTLLTAPEFDAALGEKFKDPRRYVVSAVRLAYDDNPISNTRPMINWLNALGEGPYGHQTPDGYPLTEASWASPGQISRRFEIARSIGSGNAGLFDAENGGAATAAGFPQLSGRLYYQSIEPFLSANTRTALSRANSQQEWNTFLLSSPDFNYE